MCGFRHILQPYEPGEKARMIDLRFPERRRQGVVILGSGQLAADIATRLQNGGNLRYRFAGWVGVEQSNGGMGGGLRQLRDLITQRGVACVVVALSERRGVFPTEELLACRKNGIQVKDGVAFYETLSGKIPLAGLNPSSLIFGDGFHRLQFNMFCKRLVDVLVSSMGLMISFPIWLLLAIAIKLDSEGPVLFRQERIGQDERVFQLLKFRTMRWQPEPNGESRWAEKQDARLTKVGKIIRRWRLDELPQLWNVLKGDISLVGPRPDVPSLRDTLKGGVPYYSLRTAIKPGITGWAQVRYQYVSSVREGIERHEYDLYYIKNMSLLLDLRIIAETFKIVMLRKGAR
jgi:exopolysaccharide biosynthesis polyprenyl glycosylphosphotransferase